MLIDIRDLYKIYNEGKESEVRALDGVTLQIDKGEFVAIVGQSGSGKSTMMNVLGCLDVPTYGEYYLDGTDIGTLTDKQLARIRNREIGFLFQGYNLIQELNALENVTLPLIYRGVSVFDREDMAMEALAKVGMDDRAHHRPAEIPELNYPTFEPGQKRTFPTQEEGYYPVIVETGLADMQNTEIKSGIEAGDTVFLNYTVTDYSGW